MVVEFTGGFKEKKMIDELILNKISKALGISTTEAEEIISQLIENSENLGIPKEAINQIIESLS